MQIIQTSDLVSAIITNIAVAIVSDLCPNKTEQEQKAIAQECLDRHLKRIRIETMRDQLRAIGLG